MFGKRPDGRVIKNIPPLEKIMPYIMKKRYDAMNLYEDSFDCAPWDEYIHQKREQGIKITYMDILIAGIVRLMALRPKLNRFVMNGKVYARPKIWVSFAIHHRLREDDCETTIKLCFEGTETILEIADAIHKAIDAETVNWQGENGTDKLARVLTHIPSPIIKLAVNTLMWMDRHNIMPKAVVELSPFHTSFFITNLKSLGINYLYHHVYEFGTTGIFMGMGKERVVPVWKDKEVVPEKRMTFGLVSDERFCDGLYFSQAMRHLRKLMKNPALLEEPLEKKVEDVE